MDRTHFRFTEETRSAFQFLEDESEFRCVQAQPTFVRYESQNLFVNVFHGRASYELGVEIGLRTSAETFEEQFSLGDIIDLVGARTESSYQFLQASTPERVSTYVPKLAALFKRYAWDMLKGDPRTFEALRQVQLEKSNKYLSEMKLGQVRPKIEEAWRAKDYAQVVQLYESILDDLTPAEAKKFEYAKKQLS